VSAFEKLKLIGIIFDFAGEILRPEKVLTFLKRSRMYVMLCAPWYIAKMRPSSEYEIDVSISSLLLTSDSLNRPVTGSTVSNITFYLLKSSCSLFM
jgi:hypothetical protein